MKPKERMLKALQLQEPEDIVPTWELEFQLTEEAFGKNYYNGEALSQASPKERERMLWENAELSAQVAETFDYSAFRVYWAGEYHLEQIKYVRKLLEDSGIPGSGESMAEFCYALYDKPDEMKERAEHMLQDAIEWGKRQIDAGCEVILEPTDLCFNDGPFLSPNMLREFVTPYLTDGNIMPILDQLASCEPHCLHSLDPMAGVDIAEVKRLVGDKICLMGNVECDLLQTGTREEIIESAKYCIKHGAPGGGYIYSTSNVAFKGMPYENYLLILEVRQKYGRYPIEANFKDEEEGEDNDSKK